VWWRGYRVGYETGASGAPAHSAPASATPPPGEDTAALLEAAREYCTHYAMLKAWGEDARRFPKIHWTDIQQRIDTALDALRRAAGV
jgi:hypothetical protein